MEERLDRSRFEVEVEDHFVGPELDETRWVRHYLPQWTTPDRSAARYRVGDGGLVLRVEADQPEWRVEDGPMRVSNLQSGSFSGPRGSQVGQHRHRPDLVVVSPQVTRRLWTPSSGLVEAELRASPDPTCMLALWLIGFEERSEDSGELCVAELFGRHSGSPAQVNVGIKAHHDPRLRDAMTTVELDLDTTDWHSYAVVWDEHGARFYVDDRLVHRSRQRLGYPMQVMVDLFEFPEGPVRDASSYPKEAGVRLVRGAQPLRRPSGPARPSGSPGGPS